MLLQDLHQRGVVQAYPVLHKDELAVKIRKYLADFSVFFHRKARGARSVFVDDLSVLLLQQRVLDNEVLLRVHEELIELLQLGVEGLHKYSLLFRELALFSGFQGSIRIFCRLGLLRDGFEALLQLLVAQELWGWEGGFSGAGENLGSRRGSLRFSPPTLSLIVGCVASIVCVNWWPNFIVPALSATPRQAGDQ